MLKHEQANRRRNDKTRRNSKSSGNFRNERTEESVPGSGRSTGTRRAETGGEGATFDIKASKKKDQPVRVCENNV